MKESIQHRDQIDQLLKRPLPLSELRTPAGTTIYMTGPDLSEGPLPGVFYFAVSGFETLQQDPFNQPVVFLSPYRVRCFSLDLPFHEKGFDPHLAMNQWAQSAFQHQTPVKDFLDRCQEALHYLQEQNILIPEKVATAGLSRGGYMAAHFAAQEPTIKTVLGFSPLVSFQIFTETDLTPFAPQEVNLFSAIPSLLQKSLRFYIGNRDTRVQTDTCYQFIRALTDYAFENGERSASVEMMITPSVGHKGHGTLPPVFYDGANWLCQKLELEQI